MSDRFRPLVLCYHAVSASWPHYLAVDPKVFERQIRALIARGYRPAEMPEIVAGRAKLLHVTFDDAYRSLLNALPILERLEVPSTVFACPAYADEGGVVDIRYLGFEAESHAVELRSMTWDELRSLATRNIEVGSHTLTHPHLTELTDSELERELRESRARLEDELHRRCRYLSYPHGEENARVQAAARAAGYAAAFTIPGRDRPIDRYGLPRVGVYRHDGRLRLAVKTSPRLAARYRSLLGPQRAPPARDAVQNQRRDRAPAEDREPIVSRAATVVVPAHGGAEALIRLLARLDRQAGRGEPLPVIVSDDGSPHPLAYALSKRTFPRLALEIVRSESNRGPASARNLALQHVSTSCVAFLDADMVPSEGWVERLEQWAERPDGLDGIEGVVRVGARATPFTHATEAEEFGTHHGAGNVAFSAAVLREAGGFDERFYDPDRRVHFREDTELYFRLQALGRKIAGDTDWVAFHPPHSASFWTPLRLARRYAFDPLLSREHPDRFTAFLQARRVGGVPLRWARHQAAVLNVAGALVLFGAVATRRVGLGIGGGALFVSSWAANAAALSWKRRVDARLLPPLAAVSALVPWVYLWSYYRGVIRFRHRPRLR